MPFTQKTRTQALVAAARHCCVCHRYKGVKVEVHHIIHQNQGGRDDDENAIALCFDCHTDAGHYNTEHPRGSKFSPAELRAHRETWHELVRRNRVQPTEDRDSLYCRYLVCQHFDAFKEITTGDFGKLPFGNCAVLRNSTLEFHRKVVTVQRGENEHPTEWGRIYSSMEEYWIEHPDATEGCSSGDFPYFDAKREPTLIELQSISDPITRLLMKGKVPVSELAEAYIYLEEGCGDDGEMSAFQEIYRLRPLWPTYLAVTNVSGEPILLTGIDGEYQNPTDLAYRQFRPAMSNETSTLHLPSAQLPAQWTVIIPLATLLGPFEDLDFPEWSRNRDEVRVESPEGFDYQTQALVHTSFSEAVSGANMIGPATWPSAIRFRSHGNDSIQSVHELDLSNLYTLNRYWAMGSCPHLFFNDSRVGNLSYSGELFANSQDIPQTNSIAIPSNADEIVIAELEEEETYISRIQAEQFETLVNIHLSRGDVFRMKVKPGTTLMLTGYYVAKVNVNAGFVDPWRKNELIVNFLKNTIEPHPLFAIGDSFAIEIIKAHA